MMAKIQSTAIITWSNITRYCIHHFSNWDEISIRVLTQKKTPHICYGWSLVRILEKIDRVITAQHCTCKNKEKRLTFCHVLFYMILHICFLCPEYPRFLAQSWQTWPVMWENDTLQWHHMSIMVSQVINKSTWFNSLIRQTDRWKDTQTDAGNDNTQRVKIVTQNWPMFDQGWGLL